MIALPPAAAPRIAATEDVGALPLFQLYAEHTNMSQPAIQAGCAVLEVRRALLPSPDSCLVDPVCLALLKASGLKASGCSLSSLGSFSRGWKGF